MREMKDSGVTWIGTVPSDYRTASIGSLFTIKKDIIGREPETVLSITQTGIRPKDLSSNEGQNASSYAHYQIVNVGDFAMNHMDLLTGWIDISKYEGVTSPDYRVFTLNDKEMSADYFLRVFQYYYTNKVFFGFGQGVATLGRWRLPAINFKKIDVPVPPVLEQQRIVSAIDEKVGKVDALIANVQAQIEKLKDYKQSVITEVVTKGLDPAVPMKDSGIEWVGNVPAHWDVRPLYYYFAERKKKNYLGQEQNLLSLSYGKVIRKDINTSEGLLPDSFNGYNIIEPGDIVLRLTDLQNDKRSLRTGLVKEHGIITSAYVTLKAAKEVVPEYFHYLLHAYDVMKVLYNMGNGVRQGLNYSELSKMHIVAPPLDEQKNIAARLDCVCKGIESIIASKKQQLAVIDSYKKSLIYEYVTGKKEVPNEQ